MVIVSVSARFDGETEVKDSKKSNRSYMSGASMSVHEPGQLPGRCCCLSNSQ